MKIVYYFDHRDLIPARHCYVIGTNPDIIADDIETMDGWLLANMSGKYRRSERRMAGRFIVDLFEDNDAMLFKLVWA